jgi:predicted membrane-bound mannosyltransferase
MDAAAPAFEPRLDAFRWARRVTPVQAGIVFALLALGVRAIGIGSRPLWLDEAYSAWFSERGWHYLWSVVPTYEVHPPFYYSLLKLWRGLFGGGAVAVQSVARPDAKVHPSSRPP